MVFPRLCNVEKKLQQLVNVVIYTYRCYIAQDYVASKIYSDANKSGKMFLVIVVWGS